MERRVVVTGIGVVSPIGNTKEEFWDGIVKGKNGIDLITKFDTTNHRCKVAGEVKNLNFEDYFERRDINRLDDYTKYAIIASREAMKDSNLINEEFDHDRFGVFVSSGIGGLTTIQTEVTKLAEKGPNRVSPMFIPMAISNMASGNVSIEFEAYGPSHSITTACASSTHAIGEAYNYIKYDLADVMIAGGSEASVNEIGIAGFDALKALSNATDTSRASIPFDKERSGFVMGEGAGILILEDYEHAKKRGAKIYAEVVSYASTCDAYHVTSPNGEGASKAMELAIKRANINKEDISYINAHGTSTKLNDMYETAAMKRVFGEGMKDIPVSSTKSMTGHLLGAAGAVEAIACVLATENNFIPATINYKEKDEECDLDVVPNEGRKAEVNYAMSNSLGFGGHNGTLIFKKWKED